MLSVDKVDSGYGRKQVLFAVSLAVRSGEIVALIGPNGSGKSTVLKTIIGLLPFWSGEIRFKGTETRGKSPGQHIAAGLVYGPQGARVFEELSVRRNMEAAGLWLPSTELEHRIEEAVQLFPDLGLCLNSPARHLSGGQRQMLALVRAMIPQPQLLLLDEPCLGLAPAMATKMLEHVAELNTMRAVSLIVVEHRVKQVLGIAHRVYALKQGQVVLEGSAKKLAQDPDALRTVFL